MAAGFYVTLLKFYPDVNGDFYNTEMFRDIPRISSTNTSIGLSESPGGNTFLGLV